MNIFILDTDITRSAQYTLDKHCVKMILEQSQMLCTALQINPQLFEMIQPIEIPYKKSHIHHPSTKWVSANYDNFAWLVAYTEALHQEYQYRYSKQHLSYTKLKLNRIITASTVTYGRDLSIITLNPPQVVPDSCKTHSIIESYRNYYKHHKAHIFSWTKRKPPSWI